MRKEDAADLRVGSIVQIDPKAELARGDGKLAVVMVKQSWGANLLIAGSPDVIPVTFDKFEDTGGGLIWDLETGKRLREPKAPPRHHP